MKNFGKARKEQFTTRHLAVSPDGRRLAAAVQKLDPVVFPSATEISVWESATGKEVRESSPLQTRMEVGDIAFSPDGNYLVAVGSQMMATPGQDDRFLELWDVRTGELKLTRGGPNKHCMCVAFSSDGRVLATSELFGPVVLWELATGQERHRFVGARSSVDKVVFSSEGKLLAAASPDAPVFIWDVEGHYGKPPATVPFPAEDGTKLWAALDDADASVAFAAMRGLLARPGPAVALLRERLRPASAVDESLIRRSLRDLDADAFTVREKAAVDLEAVIDAAEPFLRAALKEKQSAETKRRIEAVLESAATGASGRRRQVRAVEVAEHLATPEARELVKAWSAGAEGMLLTREARAAAERLKAR